MDQHDKNDPSDSKISRRRMLVTVGTGASAAALVACGPTGGGGTDSGMTGPVDVGAVTDFAVDSCVAKLSSHLIICRDAAGFYAFTSICTHEACDVPVPANAEPSTSITCPCHRSIYNANGDIITGQTPGQASLVHYAVSIDAAGRVLVDKSTTLTDRTTRTPVTSGTDAGTDASSGGG